MKTKRKYHLRTTILLAVLCSLFFVGCTAQVQNRNTARYNYFLDVPGITKDEIKAIESFREQGVSFVYGVTPSTEAFYDINGELKGFTPLLCEWLTELFDIPFEPRLFDWDEVLAGLESGMIDFTGELTATPERRKTYIMTDAIAARFVSYFRIKESEALADIAQLRPLRYGFFSGTITYDDVLEHRGDSFAPFFVDNYDEAYNRLLSGEIDAFLDEHTSEAAYERYGNVVIETFFPILFGHVSLSTQKPANAPIISIMQKIIENGGDRRLAELYILGEKEYTRHKLFTQLTQEERSYIRNNPIVNLAAEHDNYPISFFNTHDNEFQGICFDVLREIEALTGLTFSLVNNKDDNWAVILKMLEDGDASVLSELVQNPEREGRFLWPQKAVLTDYHAFLSKEEFHNIKISEIMNTRVGLINGYAQTELFNKWFPNHDYTITYDSFTLAFEALQRDEIDVMLGSKIMLLGMTNLYERPGYKANLVLDYPYPSTFGINKDEDILCSIMDKALNLIDTADIENKWTSKTFDYRSKITQARLPWLIGAIVLLFCVLVLVLYLYFRSRQLVKIQKESSSKSIFLANMSHEIRTPMNAITGMAEMLLRGDLSGDMRSYVQDIKQAGNNLISIVNDILDISKIEAGKLEIVPVNYTLSSMVNNTVNIIRAHLAEKTISFKTSVDENIPNSLIGDEVRLRQIILNLLSNAVKYTEKGEIHFSIKMEKIEVDPSAEALFAADTAKPIGKVWLKITVSDTGKGIKPEDQAKLFNNFVQVDQKKNTGIEGTGLGLAISKRLCDAMNGSIRLHSDYGKGSTFTVIIPQDIASAEPFGSLEITEQDYDDNILVIKRTFPGAKILIVDDLPMNIKVAEGLLEPYKARVDACLGGEKAIELIKNNEYDLVFMDHMMPGMDGIETVKRIREWEKEQVTGNKEKVTGNKLRSQQAMYDSNTHSLETTNLIPDTCYLLPDTSPVPIIALTANAVAGMKEKFIENGFNDFLSKPINISKLDEIINRWLSTENGRVSGEEQRTEKRETSEASSLLIRHQNTPVKQVQQPKAQIRAAVAGNKKRQMIGLFVLSFVVVLAVSIAANSLIAFSLRTMEYNIEQRLRAVAERLAESVSAEELDQYQKIEDMELPSYQALRLYLAEYSQRAELLYVYFMRPINDALYYIIDNDFDEETRVGLDSPTDHILDDIPWLKPVLEGVTVYAGLGTYTSGWDGLLTAYAPIFDSKGEVAAVAGVDIEDTVIVKARQLLNILTIVQIIMIVVVFITGMFVLILFRKEAEAAKKANAIKDDFLARMSHELLSPMNAITGINELILRSDIPNEVRAYAQDIKQAGASLIALINDILNISNTDVNKLDQILIRRDINTQRLHTPPSASGSQLSIKGVDTVKGLYMTGGKIEKYKQVLAVFCENVQERLFLLETMPNKDTLPVFTTQVHALKSAAATIGAMEVSAQALVLEKAGKAGDFDQIKEKLPVFVDTIKELVHNIKTSTGK